MTARRPTMATAALLAALCAATGARATDNPETTAHWRPDSRDALIELVECHAATETRLRETARSLGFDPVWSFAHQSLAAEQDRHRLAGALVADLMDRVTYRALLDAHFPEGLQTDDSAERVDRWTRCIRLYSRIANDDRRDRRRRGTLSRGGATPADTESR